MELDAFLVGDELLKSSQSAAEKMGPQALLQQLQSCSLRKLKTLFTCGRFWLQNSVTELLVLTAKVGKPLEKFTWDTTVARRNPLMVV